MNGKIISLFSGIGGLDLGFEAAGFGIAVAVENDPDCRESLEVNRPDWTLAEPSGIEYLSSRSLLKQANLRKREAALVIGGPPCQPFSKSRLWVSGNTPGLSDARARMLDDFFRIVNDALPTAIVIENVNGLSQSNKNEAMQLIEAELQSINRNNRTNYCPVVIPINAADYGVPQSRHRLFIIAHRDGEIFKMPSRTHAPPSLGHESNNELAQYVTAWDAIGDLDENPPNETLELTGKWADLIPSIPEGQNYLWHTNRGGGLPLFGWRTRYWSFLLKLKKREPSWTLQASPGPATGPFHWKNRRLSIREMGRLQTFPDNYVFAENHRAATRQLGNAVPPALAEVISRAIAKQFFGIRIRTKNIYQIDKRTDTPRCSRTKIVPTKYLSRQSNYKDHPGPGKGPRAIKAWSK